MSGQRVTLYRCSHCPNQLTYLEPVSRREHGVNLQFGHSYCTAGKKYRMLKKKESKSYPPDWCPKKKSPSEYRVYTFKDIRARCMHSMFSESPIPSAYRCAVRIEGTVDLAPAAFLSKLENTPVSQLLGIEVNVGEIVEIDDGLKSCCFYLDNDKTQYLPYWDSAKARQNLYQPESTEA